MISPDMIPERISDTSFLLRFSNGGEVWARVQKSSIYSQTGCRFSFGENGQLYSTMSVEVDINRTLFDESRRNSLGEALTEFAEERELPKPFLHPFLSKVYTDWPGLPEDKIPEVMWKLIQLVGS